jgi:hypothetical protein
MSFLNLTKKHRLELSEMQQLAKIKEALKLQRELKAFFIYVANEIEAHENSGTTPQFEKFRGDLEAILRKSYRSTSQHFVRELERLILSWNPPKAKVKEHQEIIEERSKLTPILFLLMSQKIDSKVAKQVNFILSMTQKTYERAKAKVKEKNELIKVETGLKIEAKELSKQIARQFRIENAPRAELIAENEVGSIAEIAKNTEAEKTIKAIGKEPFKWWITQRDDRVRERHIKTDGQQRKGNELFTVGTNPDQFMEYPKDDRYGATLDNIINCRCVLIYEF